jgi:hypothetical protein
MKDLALDAKTARINRVKEQCGLFCCPSGSVAENLGINVDITCDLLVLRKHRLRQQCDSLSAAMHGDRIKHMTALNADHDEWDNTSYRP